MEAKPCMESTIDRQEVGDIEKCYRWLIIYLNVNKLSSKVRGVVPMKYFPNLLSQTIYSAIDSFGGMTKV